VESSIKFSDEINLILEELKLLKGITYNLHKGPLYSEVVVNDDLFKKYSSLLSKEYNFIDCGSKMTGEDFGFFTKLYPSFMFWLGTAKGERHGLHNPKFLPDDSIIDVGINIFKKIIFP